MQTAKRVTSNFTKEELRMLNSLSSYFEVSNSYVIRQAVASLYRKHDLENHKKYGVKKCTK